MSLLPYSVFPRSLFNMDDFFTSPMIGSNTLDLFDPFDDLDRLISRNLTWLNRPDFMQDLPIMPRVPQKYRISVDCSGFRPDSVKVDVKPNNMLVVSGREESKFEKDDFSTREFKKTYALPPNAEADKLVSFMTPPGRLVIEVPLKETAVSRNADLFPQIVDTKEGGKQVTMRVNVPEGVDPSKVHVSIKDRDLIVRIEDRVDKPDQTSRFHFYKRTTLPENTDLEHLKCVQDKNQITVCAPLSLDYSRTRRNIPIERRPEQQSIRS